MKQASVFFFLILLCVQISSGKDEIKNALTKERIRGADRVFTGNVATDLLAEPPWFDLGTPRSNPILLHELAEPMNRKSPLLGGLLSAAVPGAGEFYSESYLKSGAFFVAEVISWIMNLTYNQKGDRATVDFQNFADRHWNILRYAQYAKDHLAPSGGNYDGLFILGPDGRPTGVNRTILNRMERDIGGYYSHILPPYGQQQYYELIGKYPQFNQGWDDAPPEFDYGDPVSSSFKFYSGMRAGANDFYNTASTALLVVVVNHILSAADAAWSAGRYNRVHAKIGMQMRRTPFGVETIPTATLRLDW